MSLNFKQKVHIERQKNRDNFLAYENGQLKFELKLSNKIQLFNNTFYSFQKGSDDDSVKEVNENQDDDDDDEDERWEKEQIRKGVQISQVGKHLIYMNPKLILSKLITIPFLYHIN